MPSRRPPDDTLINSIVGPGTFLRGHVELNGLMRIDGDFSGSIKTDGRVIVGQGGRADCAIQAGAVVIGGLFRGDILAYERVVLLASSIVIGTITAPRLIAEDGVLLTGRFRITGTAVDATSGDGLASRRKELLLETVRTREASDAAGAAQHGSTEDRLRASENVTDVALTPGATGEWNG